MATVTLCSDGFDISDQVFSIELKEKEQIQIFVNLVRFGGISAGLIKPAINIVSNGREQTVSNRNSWMLDTSAL
jgi:hypothetical protein